MKPTSKTLSWAFVIILLAVGIFTGLGVILMHKQQLVLQGQAEATEIRISGKLTACNRRNRRKKLRENIRIGHWNRNIRIRPSLYLRPFLSGRK